MGSEGMMGFAKMAALGATAIGLLGGAMIAWRTFNFEPSGVATAEGITLVPPPVVDGAAAALRLGEAIRIQTISHQNKTENQIAEWDKLKSWLKTRYPRAHAAMSREVVGDHGLLYHWQGSDLSLPPIIVMAHQDVVPVTAGTEKDWKYPPFSGQIAEGSVWGRGSIDDKGSLIALFEALEGLAANGFKPKRSIWLVSGHDEEAGGSGARAAAAIFAQRKIKALFTLDEGSAVITDAPMINGPATLIGIAEKGYGTLKITARAIGGHSSMPPEEIATVALAKAVVAINDKQFPAELKGPPEAMIDVLAARAGGITRIAVANQWLFSRMITGKMAHVPASAAMLHSTIAPTMLEGSPKENVLPQTATALVNYRIATWNRSADIMARAKSATGTLPVELTWNAAPREPSPVSSTNSLGWKYIRAAAEAATPGAPVAPYLVVAGTDSHSLTEVSQDVYRFAPFRLAARETGMIHGTNEHMKIENLSRMIRFYSQLIATSAG
jgi:carboxypeptidase PM20D1